MKTIMKWFRFGLSMGFKNLLVLFYESLYRFITGKMIIHEIMDFPYPLYQSSKFSTRDSFTLLHLEIDTVIDLEGDPDELVGTDFGTIIRPSNYLYWPIKDEPKLPNLNKLRDVALWGLYRLRTGSILLTHCAAGHNRSGLVNGMILVLMEMKGKDAVKLIQKRVPGALANDVFKEYLEEL